MIVEYGMVVTLDFELRDAQGELIQEHGGEPIVYFHGGENEVFPKLQQAVEGKSVGDEIFVQLEPDEAFGDFDPDLMRVEELEIFAENLEIGMQLEEVPVADENAPDEQASDENTGFGCVWTVTDIAEGKVVLDGNHPFAGMSLRYHLRVLDIRLANEEEKALGAAAQSLFSVIPNPKIDNLN
jgi:FKBP-type peptidyl-prolyl cis-trans isomerase SlyD